MLELTKTKRATSSSRAARTTAFDSALLTSVSVCGLPTPSTMPARWIACVQPENALRASRRHAQIAAVDLAALAHPRGRGALVGDADLVVGVAEQAADDRRAEAFRRRR